MADNVQPFGGEEQEVSSSGLLLSVDPLPGTTGYKLSSDDTDKSDSALGDSDGKDTSDSDGSDASDSDGSDTLGGDTDTTDKSDSDADGTDVSDADGTDTGLDADGMDPLGIAPSHDTTDKRDTDTTDAK
jgi:cobalamin biosynthesis protein CobT